MDDDLEGYWDDEAPKDVTITFVPAQDLAKKVAEQKVARAKVLEDWEDQQKAETKKDREDRLKDRAEASVADDRKKSEKIFHKIIAKGMAGPRPHPGVRNMPGQLDEVEKKIADVWAQDLSMREEKVAGIVTTELGVEVKRQKVVYALSKKVFNDYLIGIVRNANEAKALRVISMYLDAGLDESKRRDRKIQHSVIMESVKLASGTGSMGRPKKRLAFTMEEY